MGRRSYGRLEEEERILLDDGMGFENGKVRRSPGFVKQKTSFLYGFSGPEARERTRKSNQPPSSIFGLEEWVEDHTKEWERGRNYSSD